MNFNIDMKILLFLATLLLAQFLPAPSVAAPSPLFPDRASLPATPTTSADSATAPPPRPGTVFDAAASLPAHAEDRETAGETPAEPARGWRWRRPGPWEYGAVAAAAAASVYLEYDAGDPKSAGWGARNGFDESVRDLLRLRSKSARRATSHASDALMGLMIAAPPIDAAATLWFRDRDRDSLYQTMWINLESFTFTSFVSVLLQTQLARERPFVRECRDGNCESDQIYRSMPSGHTAYAFTGAGLLCTHHEFQGSYRNPAAERAVCATAVGLASVEGVLRIMVDGHYATDVIAGAAIGAFSGFLLPRLLHYWSPTASAPAKRTSPPERSAFTVTPTLLPGFGAGLSCSYAF